MRRDRRALTAKVLSFDVSLVSPLLMLSGYVAFRASPGSRFKDVGRIGIGLGLMLLSLHLMVEAIQPVGASAVFKDVLSLITEAHAGASATEAPVQAAKRGVNVRL